MTRIMPVIMCGGAGARLWPLSRESMPKQFIPLFGDRSTFQRIAGILSRPELFEDLVVVTNHAYRFIAAEQLAQAGVRAEIVLEPMRRDSAAAVAVAAELAIRRDPDAVVAIMAADHAIGDADGLIAALLQAGSAAASGRIVTLGVAPDHPATGYGYIEKGRELDVTAGVYEVARFVEKPDPAAAAAYVRQGFLWNSGNFIFPASLMRSELQAFEPAVASAAAEAVASAARDLEFLVLDKAAFARAPQTSIDYAVMERTGHAVVVPAQFGWSDVGSWSSVRDLAPAGDAGGAAVIGDGLALDCEGVLIHSPDILTAAVGLKDVIVVTTPDSVLVVGAQSAGRVKDLVAMLQERQRIEAVEHRRTLRPWGYYQAVDSGARYQVKRIVVKPGGRLSLQQHHHRAEHWVVVRGTAEVTVGETIRLVHENESVFVPIGAMHRLANPGKIDLELIEVQTGSYLGEDDIIRVEDVYNRETGS